MAERPENRSVVRRGLVPPDDLRPLVTPLYPSVAYRAASPDALDDQYEGRTEGYTYAREGHPNADVLADKLDWLEGMHEGVVTASGMAALTAIILATVEQGAHVVAGEQLYGRSMRMLSQDLPRFGVGVSFVDTCDADAVRAAVRPETQIVLVEVMSNPTLRIADLEGIAAIAREEGLLLVVDNTFTTPRAIRPADYGADIVFSSVTKLLAGHSDATLGYVAARNRKIRARLRDVAVTWGLTPSPFDCWLAERGLHSFAVRYDRATENAAELADFLAAHEAVERVIYPGRADHPDHARAAALLAGAWGNMLSFTIAGGRRAANALVTAAPDIAFAPTLGDIGTTLSHPATSSHRGLDPSERTALGITEGFFRLSVGIEDIDLLRDELDRALIAAQAERE